MKRYHLVNVLAVLLAAVIVVIWAQVFLLIFPGLGFGGIAARATRVLSPTATVVPAPSPTPMPTPSPSHSPSPSPSPTPSLSPTPSPSPSPSPSPVPATPTRTPPPPTATPTVAVEVLGVEGLPVTGLVTPAVLLGSAMGLLIIVFGGFRRWLEKRE